MSHSPILDALDRATGTDKRQAVQVVSRLLEVCDASTAGRCRYEDTLGALIYVFKVLAEEARYEPMESGVELLLRATGKDTEIA